MSIEAKVSDFQQTAQSLLSGYYTLAKGKICFFNEDIPVYGKPTRLQKADFAKMAEVCAIAYRMRLEQGEDDTDAEKAAILKNVIDKAGRR